jgi:phosphohistidine swiveling domain-containing protein
MSENKPQTPAPGQLVPTPPDFPVTWDDPQDAKITWLTVPQYKTPIPLLIYFVVKAFMEGGNAGLEKAALPFEARMIRINSFAYLGMAPKDAPPEAVMKAIGFVSRNAPGMFNMMMGKMSDGMSKQQEAALNPIIERFDTYWNDELLPEIKQHIAYFESSDLRGMSLDQLRAHLAEVLKRTDRIGGLHHEALMPMLFSMSQFEEFYCELFEGATSLDALRLTQGFENLTVKSDRTLWELSRTARANAEVYTILSEFAASEVIPALEKSPVAQSFLADLCGWLKQYGQRLNSVFNLSEPAWIEDPTPAIQNLQAYITLPDRQPEVETAAADEREKAVAEARARLAGYPQPIIARFETLLKAAQVAAIVHEDHNVWIDQRFFYHVRRICMEFGARLAQAGILETADDIFYLTPEELLNSRDTSMKDLVQERKVELERFSQITPPPMLGTAPPFELTNAGSMVRAIFKGEMAQSNSSQSEASMVKGLAGSAGITRGTARVLYSLTEASKLQPGDILVTAFTEPPWTPLFATAAAVVTDQGGVLSHTAVVAREYRIPAVVGTGSATSIFQDGQLIEVDGNTGIVRVVIEEYEHEPALVG